MTPRVGGLGDTSLSSGELLVKSNILDHRGGETIVQGFHDDYFVAQADVTKSGYPEIWVRYTDANNGYEISTKGTVSASVYRYENGESSQLGYASFNPNPGLPYTLRVVIYNNNGTDTIKVYTNDNLQLTVTDDDPLPPGGVAFGGDGSRFDDAKVGYDNNGDGDIADDGDDIIWDESFGSTSKTVSHDHAGNLIDDGTYRYVYDAWNRLVKVQSSQDSGAATVQESEFFADGRRAKKVVTNSGDHDGTVVYLHDGQKIIETRDGSGNLYQQFVHGTQYIDELVMIRVKDRGDLYVHQDANWNVVGLTDLGGSLVERNVYTPYGELTVYQETGYGDRDADGDVDATDKGTVGTTCTGTVSGACRILDLDFDGDYDATDASKFDSLPQGLSRHPGRIATNVSQPFAHQGLLYEPELSQYQNRARQLAPTIGRFLQRDPPGTSGGRGDMVTRQYKDGTNSYAYVRSNPGTYTDASGLKCAIELVCWPAFGFPYGGDHCEFQIIETSHAENAGMACHGDAALCHWGGSIELCAKPTWRPIEYGSGAWTAEFKWYPYEDQCDCLRLACLNYPLSQLYTLYPDAWWEANSNTEAKCINRKCNLGFSDIVGLVAPGWDHNGCPLAWQWWDWKPPRVAFCAKCATTRALPFFDP